MIAIMVTKWQAASSLCFYRVKIRLMTLFEGLHAPTPERADVVGFAPSEADIFRDWRGQVWWCEATRIFCWAHSSRVAAVSAVFSSSSLHRGGGLSLHRGGGLWLPSRPPRSLGHRPHFIKIVGEAASFNLRYHKPPRLTSPRSK